MQKCWDPMVSFDCMYQIKLLYFNWLMSWGVKLLFYGQILTDEDPIHVT